ncbi:hypothetical protein [Vibrio anguillarum]|uniref:hypothetical protein n=4 Tax=Vibrio anguillarum TaxID=55601 RepID=UPI000BB496D7|nr:hypothetical protein [Vibrio anguillarum]ATC60094.1 hypothetical protein CMV05_22050 [Vibrio anguillarum]MBF4249420.1 hypothetical protein [Vibrio anguillarum]MBF4341255.1 hypothetical protein [Vibrio anguillarum]
MIYKCCIAMFAVAALSGCGDRERLEDISSQLIRINNEMGVLRKSVSSMQVPDDQRLAKLITNNPRMSSIAAYLLFKSKKSTIDSDLSELLLYASKEMNGSIVQKQLYQSLSQQGFASTVVVNSQPSEGMKEYIVRGEWTVEVPVGSSFDMDYPYDAFELMQYERVSYAPDVCGDGFSPVVVHALMKKSGIDNLPSPNVDIVKESNAWRVIISEQDEYKAFSSYRVLFDVRCIAKAGG